MVDIVSDKNQASFEEMMEDLGSRNHALDKFEATMMSSMASTFVSCIIINGTPVLPPVLTGKRREEMASYKADAVKAESRMKAKRRALLSRDRTPRDQNVIQPKSKVPRPTPPRPEPLPLNVADLSPRPAPLSKVTEEPALSSTDDPALRTLPTSPCPPTTSPQSPAEPYDALPELLQSLDLCLDENNQLCLASTKLPSALHNKDTASLLESLTDLVSFEDGSLPSNFAGLPLTSVRQKQIGHILTKLSQDLKIQDSIRSSTMSSSEMSDANRTVIPAKESGTSVQESDNTVADGRLENKQVARPLSDASHMSPSGSKLGQSSADESYNLNDFTFAGCQSQVSPNALKNTVHFASTVTEIHTDKKKTQHGADPVYDDDETSLKEINYTGPSADADSHDQDESCASEAPSLLSRVASYATDWDDLSSPLQSVADNVQPPFQTYANEGEFSDKENWDSHGKRPMTGHARQPTPQPEWQEDQEFTKTSGVHVDPMFYDGGQVMTVAASQYGTSTHRPPTSCGSHDQSDHGVSYTNHDHQQVSHNSEPEYDIYIPTPQSTHQRPYTGGGHDHHYDDSRPNTGAGHDTDYHDFRPRTGAGHGAEVYDTYPHPDTAAQRPFTNAGRGNDDTANHGGAHLVTTESANTITSELTLDEEAVHRTKSFDTAGAHEESVEEGEVKINNTDPKRKGSYTLEHPSPALVKSSSRTDKGKSSTEKPVQRMLDYDELDKTHVEKEGKEEHLNRYLDNVQQYTESGQGNAPRRGYGDSPDAPSAVSGQSTDMTASLMQSVCSDASLANMSSEDLFKLQEDHFNKMRQQIMNQTKREMEKLYAQQQHEQVTLQNEIVERMHHVQGHGDLALSVQPASTNAGYHNAAHGEMGLSVQSGQPQKPAPQRGQSRYTQPSYDASQSIQSTVSNDYSYISSPGLNRHPRAETSPPLSTMEKATPKQHLFGSAASTPSGGLNIPAHKPVIRSPTRPMKAFNRKSHVVSPHQANHPSMKPKFDRISAVAKGYLTRRLIQTVKVQNLVKTIKDTRDFAMNFQSETSIKKGQFTVQDRDLLERIIAQLQAALLDVHELFFVIPVHERMGIITQARQQEIDKRYREPEVRARSGHSTTKKYDPKVSAATLKAIERKKRALAAEESMLGITTNRPKSAPAQRMSNPSTRQSMDHRALKQLQGHAVPPGSAAHHDTDTHDYHGHGVHSTTSQEHQHRNLRPKTAPDHGTLHHGPKLKSHLGHSRNVKVLATKSRVQKTRQTLEKAWK